ncbi:MAG: DUF4058 family protein [Coleofasciculus sp. D1-CHI-01]|uniref:DUF4058 family protein n=1 Tax=Coleofasciculus sp. D1-CHI-01 TaxID=3068482 RepID=UPI0032F36225
MASPFPGMNPYLEHPDFWVEVHNRLIVAISDVLVPQVRPKYRVAIEILSPVNKRTGEGRETYLKKRQKIFGSLTHLIEIDLMRQWQPMPLLNNTIQSDYRILISRQERRPQADLYAFNLPQPIPAFPIPLRAGDREPVVDLQALLHQVDDRAGYDYTIDYSRELIPSLSEADTLWVNDLLHEL